MKGYLKVLKSCLHPFLAVSTGRKWQLKRHLRQKRRPSQTSSSSSSPLPSHFCSVSVSCYRWTWPTAWPLIPEPPLPPPPPPASLKSKRSKRVTFNQSSVYPYRMSKDVRIFERIPVVACAFRRSNPSTPTQPRRPDFIGVVYAPNQPGGAYYEFQPTEMGQGMRPVQPPSHTGQYGSSPQRRFMSEGELVRQEQQLSYPRSNNTVDNIRELANSPQRGVYMWKDTSPSGEWEKGEKTCCYDFVVQVIRLRVSSRTFIDRIQPVRLSNSCTPHPLAREPIILLWGAEFQCIPRPVRKFIEKSQLTRHLPPGIIGGDLCHLWGK